MSAVQRANTWEISDSEEESDENKPSSSSSSSCVILDQDTCTNESNPSAASRSTSGRPEDGSIRAAGEKRRRRTREEEQEIRRAATETRRQLKEEKLQEQQQRKEAAVRVSLLKPENFIKSLTLQIHAALLRDAGCDVLLGTVDGLQWRNRIENQGLPNSFSWTRQALQTEDEAKNGVIEEDQVLMVISHNEFEDMVMSHKTVTNQSAPIGDVYEEAESLLQHLYKYLNKTSRKFVTILVISHQQRSGSGDEDDFGFHLNQHHLDTEGLLVHLQLYWNVSVNFLFGWQEVTDHVVAVTKALSKRPYKALCGDPDLGFCMDGSWSAGVRVDRDGRGLAQVWTRQIQQLNRVSPALAKAVTSVYPSPSLLLQAYEELPSEEERRRLLADLAVVGGAKERRVGPELAGRIYRLLTSQNPHLLLD
ncbi:essential meiotic structure-specific endonuclease subunit 2 [Sinocyclocheilus rhinocerous]|uniref:essential meiotic structure-specific endonuclease subunit 2 n=1 Tax=Sinocyclocheilus rhinocerous TaxID=307959 RepID=UPI0007B97BC4|nr:PREDICTED: crossover junction endonuclease EME1-like [Sinocyclocheilus rhinocerous]